LNSTFLILAIGLALLALAPIFYRLLGKDSETESERQTRRSREALVALGDAGVLSGDELASKLAALPVTTGNHRPAAITLAAIIAVVLPISAMLIYRQVGEPLAQNAGSPTAAAMGNGNPHQGQGGQAPLMDLDAALASLAAKLQQNPQDAEGWRLLGRGYLSMERFAEALAAVSRARALLPGDLDTEMEYSEALSLSTPDRQFAGEPQTLLDAALKRDPLNQRGLWLAGIAAQQRGDTDSALQNWKKLASLLPADAEALPGLQQQIASLQPGGAVANGAGPAVAAPSAAPMAGAPANTDANPAAAIAASPGAGAAITVTVDLAAELKARVAASDTLFVFARAASGPRMPLAIQRLGVGQFPISVTLDDSSAMMPAMRLSAFPEIVIGARISKSGQAIAASGDLQGLSATVTQTSLGGKIAIQISEVVP
jgi:cytochrome c-type biogenesis protein CcmH